MFVSVIVTALNAEKWLDEMIVSVLNQTHSDFELIVVDDGSIDQTLTIAQRYAEQDHRVQVLTHDNWGMATSANDAIRHAKGPWIARVDADDVMLPQRLERQISYLQENPDVVAASCLVYYIDEKSTIISKYTSSLTTREAFNDKFEKGEPIGLHHQGVIMRKDTFQAVGGYRGEFWPADDMDLWNRMAEHGYVLVQPEYLQMYRIHGSSISHTAIRNMGTKTRWIKQCVEYRRSGFKEPTWDEFVTAEESEPRLRRANRFRTETGNLFYKSATLHYSAGRRTKAISNMLVAVALRPSHCSKEVNKKFLHLSLPRRQSSKSRPITGQRNIH